jgi:hypothetical protein
LTLPASLPTVGTVGSEFRRRLLIAVGLVCFEGCVSLDEIQTPNGDLDLSSDEAASGGGAAGQGGSAGQGNEADTLCGRQGFRIVRAAGRDVLGSWSRASLVSACGGSGHRLSALAPRLGSAFAVDLTADGTRVIQATYSTTAVGADGEEWGEYEAVVDVSALRFGAALQAGEQPFELTGNILGPYGPVSFEAAGCADVRLNPCQ